LVKAGDAEVNNKVKGILHLVAGCRLEMEVLLRSGSAKEQALARKILPVIADEHWLLVSR
jgi:hypothetical protein